MSIWIIDTEHYIFQGIDVKHSCLVYFALFAPRPPSQELSEWLTVISSMGISPVRVSCRPTAGSIIVTRCLSSPYREQPCIWGWSDRSPTLEEFHALKFFSVFLSGRIMADRLYGSSHRCVSGQLYVFSCHCLFGFRHFHSVHLFFCDNCRWESPSVKCLTQLGQLEGKNNGMFLSKLKFYTQKFRLQESQSILQSLPPSLL